MAELPNDVLELICQDPILQYSPHARLVCKQFNRVLSRLELSVEQIGPDVIVKSPGDGRTIHRCTWFNFTIEEMISRWQSDSLKISHG